MKNLFFHVLMAQVALAVVMMFGLAPSASAQDKCVRIDPAGFDRLFEVRFQYGKFGPYQGTGHCVPVEPKSHYQIVVSHGVGFDFHTDDRSRAACNNTVGLRCKDDLVTFRTTEIVIDPAQYQGLWHLRGLEASPVWPRRRGDGKFSAVVIKGVSTQAKDGGYAIVISHGNEFRFNIDAGGQVLLNRFHADSAIGGSKLLTFRNAMITIDPGAYRGPWAIAGVSDSIRAKSVFRHWTKGRYTQIPVIPGMENVAAGAGYELTFRHGSSIRFNVNGHGQVWVNQHYHGAARTRSSSLELKTAAILIEPKNGHKRPWCVDSAEQPSSVDAPFCILKPGPRAFVIVTGTQRWVLLTGRGADVTHALFDVSPQGVPVYDEPLLTSDSEGEWEFIAKP